MVIHGTKNVLFILLRVIGATKARIENVHWPYVNRVVLSCYVLGKEENEDSERAQIQYKYDC